MIACINQNDMYLIAVPREPYRKTLEGLPRLCREKNVKKSDPR